MNILKKQDPKLYKFIEAEAARQKDGLEMIPSENYASAAVMAASGSILTNKYSEGYCGRRYYGGNQFIDRIETLAIDRAKKLFKVAATNVQPYSGSPANFAVYLALCRPGDTIMGLELPHGGHLTHGWKVSATGIFFKSVPYHVTPDGRIDFDEVRRKALEFKPRLIWAGATAYIYNYDYKKFAEIADEVGAYFAADIAHVAGLIISGVHNDPAPHAHVITTTTHKTLRGPRGGLILTTQKGLDKDPELASKIDKAVFPGLQGGPHDHQTAAIAVALLEASKPAFKAYGRQIVKNAKTLAAALSNEGFKLVGGKTENHLILLDLIPSLGVGGGAAAQIALDEAGITTNKNTIPADPSSPFYPSGLRLGTPALTTRGMKEAEMKKIARWIARAAAEISAARLPDDKTKRSAFISEFTKKIHGNAVLAKIRAEIKKFARSFPVPGLK